MTNTYENEMILRSALGEILREERLAQGLSLRTVSKQASISLGFLSEIERGKKEIGSEFLNQVIIAGLGVAPHEIVMRAALRMAGLDIPDTPESLYTVIDEYADLG
jgi:transcriptional regulator with XRE-family HTH domain